MTLLLCTQTSWAQVGSHGKQFSSLCTAHLAPVLCRLPRLHGGAGIPGIGVLIYSWYCGIGISSGDGIWSRSRDAETSAWRAHGTCDWSASTAIKHCDERSSVWTRGSRENNGTVGVETAPGGHESRKARAVRTWQRLWRLGFHIQRIRGYARSCLSCLAEYSETIANSGDGDSTTRTAVCNLAVLAHGAHTERSTESREEGWKQRFRSLPTTVLDVRNVRSVRQHGTIRANHDDLQVCFQDWRRGRPSERISGTGETIWWGERYRSRSRPSEKGVHYFETRLSLWKHIFSWMLVNWETSTHHAWRLKSTWGADASSRRLQPETHTKIQWKSMQSAANGKAKRNPARARRVVRKEKKSTQAKVTEKRQQNTHDSMVCVETVESMDTKHLIVGTSGRTNRWKFAKVCSRIVLKCLQLARIGRSDILWYVNKLARAVTRWTKAYDRRLARLIFLHSSDTDHRQYCHVGNTAGLRMDGIPALDPCDVTTEVLHSSKNTHPHPHQARRDLVRGEIKSTNPQTKPKRRKNPRCWWIV